MISVILAILKIIGIVLLCLLGLLLLIILAVLLVPIRYQAAGSAAEKEIHARAGISWLLHLIQVKLELVNQKAGITVKLFGIPIRRMGTLFESAENEENPDSGNSSRKTDSEETGKNAERQRTDSNSETRIPKISDEVLESLPMEKNVLSEERKADRTQPAVRTVNRQKESTSKSEEEQKPQKEKNPESAAEAKKAGKAQRNTDRGRQRAERTKQKEEHAKRKEAQKEQKIQQKEEKRRRREKQREKLEDFLDQIQNPENQRAFRLVRTQTGKLLLHILPTRLSIQARVGLSDPAATGMLLGAFYALYPIYQDHIRVTGEFETEVLEGSFRLKGRIRIGSLLMIVFPVIRDKSVRRLIKQVFRR
ncbi:DUF2953 domain-containing protein [Lachnospiraceae bacterium CLA-AA-H215]|uniref:DUF2953 domain-containing protein n=1 Tax=Hominifimenecus microfluidus TaxID=2885348 RepID=A0AAE3JFE2_9FIRM|nr:DUF2953 domain-containing protein [Hominifimenecus microfluidus]MCC2231385.1 DUF2953 domain-containing protein [Hominifimenecus microfluidus]